MNGEAAPDGPEGIQFSDDMRDAYCAIGVPVFQALASLLSMFAAPQARLPQKAYTAGRRCAAEYYRFNTG